MSDFFFQIYKIVGIFIVLSPIFLGAILVAYLLQKGFDTAKRYAIFWLIASIALSLISVYLLFEKEFQYSTFFVVTSWISVASAKYASIQKRHTKKQSTSSEKIRKTVKK